jgi:wobble nucleotide-excising tRNase
MTTKFELSVRDSFGDEAKSEGQFAVVSFAYIGGIFKLLAEIEELADKEFPLVLDGPFSKLDVIQRQNVIDTIPTYAPQVILFSKDDINACFGENGVDNVWTIYSNDERNVSFVKQGYDPEVFIINGTDN